MGSPSLRTMDTPFLFLFWPGSSSGGWWNCAPNQPVCLSAGIPRSTICHVVPIFWKRARCTFILTVNNEEITIVSIHASFNEDCVIMAAVAWKSKTLQFQGTLLHMGNYILIQRLHRRIKQYIHHFILFCFFFLHHRGLREKGGK